MKVRNVGLKEGGRDGRRNKKKLFRPFVLNIGSSVGLKLLSVLQLVVIETRE